MKVIRESTHITGFLYEAPVSELPALTHCGEALCARGHSLKPHCHAGFEFCYLSRGQFGWVVGKKDVKQQAGEIFVVYPNELHGTGILTNPESHFLWIGLQLEKFSGNGLRVAALLKKNKSRLLTNCHETEVVLRGLISQVTNKRPKRAAAVSAYIAILITLLEQSVLHGETSGDEVRDMRPYSHGIQRSLSYMEKNLDRRIPLGELAAIAIFRHVSHFCAQFRREVGLSPSDFHKRCRLYAVRQALRQPATTITAVAMQFGFNSSQHLSACFSHEFGLSPSTWAKNPQKPIYNRIPSGQRRFQ